MDKTLEERVQAIETWIKGYEKAEAEWLKENQDIVFVPAAEFFRDRKKDH